MKKYVKADSQDEQYKAIKDNSATFTSHGSAGEMTDIIFDTLFGNTQFPQFDLDKLTPIYDDVTQEVNRKAKTIEFGYDGHTYKINVELTD